MQNCFPPSRLIYTAIWQNLNKLFRGRVKPKNGYKFSKLPQVKDLRTNFSRLLRNILIYFKKQFNAAWLELTTLWIKKLTFIYDNLFSCILDSETQNNSKCTGLGIFEANITMTWHNLWFSCKLLSLKLTS